MNVRLLLSHVQKKGRMHRNVMIQLHWKKKKKNNQKKAKFKNLVVKLQLGYLAIFSNHIIYFDISEPLQF